MNMNTFTGTRLSRIFGAARRRIPCLLTVSLLAALLPGPSVSATAAPAPPAAPAPELFGVADTHAHLMAHLGFGGRLFHGAPEGAHGQALDGCALTHLPGGVALTPELGHGNAGFPDFSGWPNFHSMVHQQAHLDWIRRAYDGGLRLVSMLAVNNRLLPAVYEKGPGIKSPFPHDDRTAINLQIDAAKQMAARHSAWMEIAYSSADARRIISQNKLAIVLGTEVDALGNWQTPGDLPPNLEQARGVIRAELERLYSLGVRQVTPVHLTDNFYGGCAVYNKLFDALNSFATGQFYDVESAPAGSLIRYRLSDEGKTEIGRDPAADILGGFLMKMVQTGVMASIDPKTGGGLVTRDGVTAQVPGGHMNRKGITPYGTIFFEEAVRLGMIIDINHMSEKTLAATLAMAEQKQVPVIASHTGVRELALAGRLGQPTANEGNLTVGTLQRIRNLGGFVGAILHQGDLASAPGSKVANDSPGSSKTWAQAYQFISQQMGGRGVGIGSDINGLASLLSPRFGTYASHYMARQDAGAMKAQAAAQTKGVRYSTPFQDYRGFHWEGKAASGDDAYVWEAVALGRSTRGIDGAPMPILDVKLEFKLPRTAGTNAWIKDVAKGIRFAVQGGTDVNKLEPLKKLLGLPNINLLGQYNIGAAQRGAFLAARQATVSSGEDDALESVFRKVRPIWMQFEAMQGDNAPLPRSVAGQREFDFNVDGMAHYGMLRDFLVDLRNIGLSEQDLQPLYRSAEHYVQTWERCDQKRSTPIVPPAPPAPPAPPQVRAMRATMNPSTITVRLRTRRTGKSFDPIEVTTGSVTVNVTVTAVDAATNQPLDAEVYVGNRLAARTGQAFRQTFTNGPKPVIKVVKPGYTETVVEYTRNVVGDD
jgi:microsomal dipeptidase-like Zn-dependent dipeptidase